MRWLVVVTGTLALGSACGGDNGPNPALVANFTQTCTALGCTFDDTSTPEGGISSWSWNFGDANSGANNTASIQNPSHTFSAAGTYTVSLTAGDATGATNLKTNPVTVVAGDPLPTAGFTYTCTDAQCAFTNTSADAAPGTIASYLWNFGDPASGATNNSSILEGPTHSFTGTGNFTVTLTVTDNVGGTDVETQIIPVSQGLVCTGVDCMLDLTSRSTVTITVTESVCLFTGNAFAITAPIQETVFTDGCTVPDNTVFTINGGAAFNAGTSLEAQFTKGTPPPGDPAGDPATTRVSGEFPNWMIEFDDGGDPDNLNEPDYDDIVLIVRATVVP